MAVAVGQGLKRVRLGDLTEKEWCAHYTDKLREKCNGSEGDPLHQCWEYMGRSKKGSRYKSIDVVIPGIGRTVRTAHRVAYMTSIRGSWSLPAELEVSHLCSRPACVRPAHLVMESHDENMSRRNCNSFQKCLGHGARPACILPPPLAQPAQPPPPPPPPPPTIKE